MVHFALLNAPYGRREAMHGWGSVRESFEIN